jgi:hypothetical protein
VGLLMTPVQITGKDGFVVLAMRLAEPVERLTFNRDTLTGRLARLPVTW